MRIRKLESTDAFVAVDADGAPGQGVVRLAPKALQGGAKDLARSVTYTLACLGRRETGISAGINAPAEEASDAVAAFIAEVSDWDGGYRFGAGTGVDAAALGPLGLEPADPLPAAVAAAMAARPDASTAAVLNDDPEALAGLLAGHGVEVVDGDPRSAGVDLLFTAGKPGTIDHATAEGLAAAVVIPTSRLVVGTRALRGPCWAPVSGPRRSSAPGWRRCPSGVRSRACARRRRGTRSGVAVEVGQQARQVADDQPVSHDGHAVHLLDAAVRVRHGGLEADHVAVLGEPVGRHEEARTAGVQTLSQPCADLAAASTDAVEGQDLGVLGEQFQHRLDPATLVAGHEPLEQQPAGGRFGIFGRMRVGKCDDHGRNGTDGL